MRNMKLFKTALLLTAITVSMTGCGSGKTSSSETYDRDVDSEVRNEVRENVQNTDLLKGELENKTIKWLSHWDINPDVTGKNKPTELVAFEEKYGGKIEWINVTWEKRYEKLAEMIANGEGVDFFPANDMDAFPKGAVRGMFVPVDDYIDFSSPLWEDVKDINDSLMWNDSHYCTVLQATGDKVACIYNRKTMSEAGLEDPADLYARGEWDWDAFESMLKSFVDPANQHYGIEGWWFEFALMNTTGVPAVGLENCKLVNNLSDPSIERVQNWLYDLNTSGCIAIGSADYGWDSHPEYVGEGKVLFYPVGLYELYKSEADWKKVYGEDAFFVPMPRDPEADDYYIPVGMESYVFVKGGQNPEGVAKFLDCKRFAILDEATKSIADQQFRDDYGWTDEMVEMQHSMQELADANPFFDMSTGVSTDCAEILDNQLRAAARGTPWNETYDAIYNTVDTFINEINADPIQNTAE